VLKEGGERNIMKARFDITKKKINKCPNCGKEDVELEQCKDCLNWFCIDCINGHKFECPEREVI